MHIEWRSSPSVIRFPTARVFILFGAPGLLSLAAANHDCAIRDAETFRKLDLDTCRPEPVSALQKAAVLRSLPVDGEVTHFSTGERRKLAELDPVLRAQSRKGVYEIKIITVPQAWTGLHARSVLLISMPALVLLTSEELQALVAHEIGHEYVWQQYESARARKDAKRLRELELVCDAIAIATLRRIGVAPESLESATEKVFSYNRERLGVALNNGHYPSFKARRKFIREMMSANAL
jgi:hypothetical protein